MKKNILYSLLTIAALITTGCESLDTTQFDQNVTGNNDGKLDSKYVLLPSLSFANGQAAEVVIGQVDMVSNSSNPTTASSMNQPYGNAYVNDGKLYLHSYSDNRVLVYNRIPTTNGESANIVIGQDDFTSTLSGTGPDGLDGPQTVASTANKYAGKYSERLVITEYNTNRISIYNAIPTESGAQSDVVVGQPDYYQSGSGCTATSLSDPETITIVDGKLIITDTSNHRVLIYNEVPDTSGAAADLVLGQNSFTNCVSNDDNQDGISDSATARTLNEPAGVWSDGRKLVVNDMQNNRVLIWNTFPTSDFQQADIVLGQPNFNSTSNLLPSQKSLSRPYDGVFSNGKQLFVSDTNNNRIMVWNTFPTQNYQAADIVLGQDDFVSNASSVTAKNLDSPTGVYQYMNKLIVTDRANNRYLIFSGS